jgi:putative endonuclease
VESRSTLAFYVYILLCSDGSFYTGYTKNVDKRARLHACGKGARYTKTHQPKKIVYVEMLDSRGEAMRREKAIKKMSHQRKIELVESSRRNVSSDEKRQS